VLLYQVFLSIYDVYFAVDCIVSLQPTVSCASINVYSAISIPDYQCYVILILLPFYK